MSVIGVVVADTTPLNYLIVLQRAHILPALFGTVLIRPEVLEELTFRATPELMERFAAKLKTRRG